MGGGQKEGLHGVNKRNFKVFHQQMEVVSKVIDRVVPAPNKEVLSVAGLEQTIVFDVQKDEVGAVLGFFRPQVCQCQGQCPVVRPAGTG